MSMRTFASAGPLLVPVLLACRQDMHDQPRYKPLAPSRFFSDGRSARELVPGTVPRGQSREDTILYEGRDPDRPVNTRPPAAGGAAALRALQVPAQGVEGAPDKLQLAAWRAIHAAEAAGGSAQRQEAAYATAFPFPITMAVLERGRERYDIFCAPCHDRLGTGRGMIVRKGFLSPPSYHSARLRDAAVGHFFDVISRGFGAMPSYAAQIAPADRWAIVGYVRALQLSQAVPAAELGAADRAALGAPQ